MSYTPTIGLEVHAELKTETKMFCGCKNEPHGSEPNAHTCPVCLAHPGTLPVPNESAIEKVLMFGNAVDATIATFTEFDRKNYFYPDIPKAYQISQYAYPFIQGGELGGVALTRVHLEEDTARSQHDQGEGSLVDFNRAGVPLMELVTEPVIHDAATAGNFARELQLLLRTLGISDANMEKGEMRVEANISVSKDLQLGTKVEVKNLNSFKSVEAAIEYEIQRQIELLEKGERVMQETRGWDENRSKTFVQRTKETAKDYRYFPDPDLPKMDIGAHEPFKKVRLTEKTPKLLNEKRAQYRSLGLSDEKVEVLVSNRELDEVAQKLITKGVSAGDFVLAANYLLTDITAMQIEGSFTIKDLNVEAFIEMISMLQKAEINSRTAKDLLGELFAPNVSIRAIATDRGLLQVSDAGAIEAIVAQVISEHEAVFVEFKSGKETALRFLLGQAMKISKGTANPTLLKEAFESKLQ